MAAKMKKVKQKKQNKNSKTAVDLLDCSVGGLTALIDSLKDCQITELSLTGNNKKITISKNLTPQSPAVPSAQVEELPESELPVVPPELIKATYVGTYHPVKGIAKGVKVKKGELLANIFSMKMEHQIKAAKDCTIEEIVLKANDPVDYGKALFVIS